MNDKEKFLVLVSNERLKKADAIILLEGDGLNRIKSTADLYKAGWADTVVVSGGVYTPDYGSYPSGYLMPELIKSGVPSEKIVIEGKSKHTREQAEEVLALADSLKWKNIILVASPHHQPRAFLTFLKVMNEKKLKLQIINAPARELSWFEETGWGKRSELLDTEFEKIEKYMALGQAATFKEAIDYQQWKESLDGEETRSAEQNISSTDQAREMLGKNFIGVEEIIKVAEWTNLPKKQEEYGIIPPIPYGTDFLKTLQGDYILILGFPFDENRALLTLNALRDFYGVDPAIKEPCFYNQDWYLKEDFAGKTTLELKWYLIRKKVIEDTRGKRPEEITETLEKEQGFPSAILTAYTFFLYYLLNKERLWETDFLWCSDKDGNGDRIYTGRYTDPRGINKNGFNVHRHLSIRPAYGLASQIISSQYNL